MTIVVPFDCETTGVAPGSRMVELAAYTLDLDTGQAGDEFSRLVNPEMPIPADATDVHGITDEDVRDQPTARVVLEEFFAWLPDDAALVAHNASFDCGVVAWDAARVGVNIDITMPVFDTCAIAREIGVTKGNHLETLVEHYGIKRVGEAHRALSDAKACGDYFLLARELCQVVPVTWFNTGYDYEYPAFDLAEELRDLPELVAAGGSMGIAYQDGKGHGSERVITPYGWALKGGLIHFHGYCHLKNARRSFRSDRLLGRIENAA